VAVIGQLKKGVSLDFHLRERADREHKFKKPGHKLVDM
jgi:hypothetical protein